MPVEPEKIGLAPVARSDARLFVLGSLPGDASLAAQRYYAHPRNAFWRLIGLAIGQELEPLGYEQRLERLTANGVGLWDVVERAVRRGSLDQAIRNPAHNPLLEYFAGFPRLKAVAFNGSSAAAAGRRLLASRSGLALIDLPSSSPANTLAYEKKAKAWAELAHYCVR